MANDIPRFWFDVDGRKFGGRLLTIGEQVQAQVEIERATNGCFNSWIKGGNVFEQGNAFNTQTAVILNKAIVAWPTDLPKVDFLESDDAEWVVRVWEAYAKSADTFREQRVGGGKSPRVAAAEPAPAVVSDDSGATV